MAKKKFKLSKGMIAFSHFIIILFVFFDFVFITNNYDSIAYGIGQHFFIFVSYGVSLWSAHKASSLASRINKSNNWAYIIGFTFNLIGLLSYYIYYKFKS